MQLRVASGSVSRSGRVRIGEHGPGGGRPIGGSMPAQILLGDEAAALGAVHAGITAAYAYPGTPSTEILEFLLDHRKRHGKPHAAWCANEKTAYEEEDRKSVV